MSKIMELDWGKMREKIVESEKKGSFKREEDKRIYKPKLKEDGTGNFIIRFLPSIDTDIPFVKAYHHAFQAPGGFWYIENCPTTIQKDCPVCQANNKAWEEGDEDLAKKRKRKLSYWSNILVIKDPQTPENEGKVFILKYGMKIQEKIMSLLDPKPDDMDENGDPVKPIMVFDMNNGANFKLSIKMTKQGPNYDASKFADSSKLTKEQQKIVADNLYPLKPFSDPANAFKPYDELKDRFDKVQGGKRTEKAPPAEADEDVPASSSPAPADASTPAPADASTPAGEENEDDFFNSLRKKA